MLSAQISAPSNRLRYNFTANRQYLLLVIPLNAKCACPNRLYDHCSAIFGRWVVGWAISYLLQLQLNLNQLKALTKYISFVMCYSCFWNSITTGFMHWNNYFFSSEFFNGWFHRGTQPDDWDYEIVEIEINSFWRPIRFCFSTLIWNAFCLSNGYQEQLESSSDCYQFFFC